jgi:hypothetical protein
MEISNASHVEKVFYLYATIILYMDFRNIIY